MKNHIRFSSFPRTETPPTHTKSVVDVFRSQESKICTLTLEKGLTSDMVLAEIRPALVNLGFVVESSKISADKIKRPVFFGENGKPTLQYEIDAYNNNWNCGLEVEAGRAWMGNAIYRDLIQALVMVELECLYLAIPNAYRYLNNGRKTISNDYENCVAVADAIYGHSRFRMPYRLVVIGY